MWIRSFSDNKEHDVTKRKARKKYLDTDEPFKPDTEVLQIVRWGPRIYLMGMYLVTVRQDLSSYIPYYQPHLIISVEPTTAKVQITEEVPVGGKLSTRIANVALF